MKLERSIFRLGRDSNELSLALLVSVDAHVEFVEAAKSVSNVDVDERGKNRLAIRTGNGERGGARSRSSVSYIRDGRLGSRCWAGGGDYEQKKRKKKDLFHKGGIINSAVRP